MNALTDIKIIIGTILVESKSEKEALERIRREIRGDAPVVEMFLATLGIALTKKFQAQIQYSMKQALLYE